MKILMVLTSHDKLGNTGRKTGFWLEEFAAPYYTFLGAGATVTVASPKGGQPPLDPVSDTPEGQTELTRRFKQIPQRRMCWRTPSGSAMSRPRITTRSSIPVATARCGTWPRIRFPSPSSRTSTIPANRSPRSAMARRAASRQVPGPTDREGQAGDGLHQRRGGSGPPHQGGAVPRGG